MGLFSKLFGNKDDITDEIKKAEKPAAQNTGFSMPVLRTVRSGGYDKTAVLGMLDSISKEYMLLKEASEAKEKGESFTLPAAADYADIPKNCRAPCRAALTYGRVYGCGSCRRYG